MANGGGGRRGRSGSFMLLLRQQEIESAADTAYYGFVVLGATWVVFVVGMGSVLGVWEWAWDVPDVCIVFISFHFAASVWKGGRG